MAANCRKTIKLVLGAIDHMHELIAYNNIAISSLEIVKSDSVILLLKFHNMIARIAQTHGATNSPETIAIGNVSSSI